MGEFREEKRSVPKSQIFTEQKGIASLLKDYTLSVPTHQRSFSWQTTEVQELLEDVHSAYSENDEYFLGTIVVMSPEGSSGPVVIDGQQRLATVALLLAAIADRLADCGKVRNAEEVRGYLTSFNLVTEEQRPRLALNQSDELRSLLAPEPSPPAPAAADSHERLYAARKLIMDWLSGQLETVGDKPRWLGKFTEYLAESAVVILVKAADDADAYMIFETLNDRGLDLSVADLLKNYLLGRASESDRDVVLTHWTSALASLNAHGGENLFSVFLRHYWSSRYSVARERTLYRDIKRNVSSRQQVVEFSAELARNSSLYAAILSPEHDYWRDASQDTQDCIRALRVLGLEQYRPLLLAAMGHLKLSEVERLARLLVNWNVRLLMVGGLGGGVMERNYSELARDIREGVVKSANDIADRAKSFVPNDAQFRERVGEITVSKVPLARYYLNALEAHVRGPGAEMDPSWKLTLEHILPEKPADNWPEFTEEETKAWRGRLGNLVLLTGQRNSQLRSAPFRQKRDAYAKSELVLTKGVSEYQTWTKETIEKRQHGLADLAVAAWPLGGRARRPRGSKPAG